MTNNPWTPAENPDPSEILNSAAHDKRDGNYERALAKHLWFHQSALVFQDSLSAVRLSFALGYWSELASVYPPAQEAMEKTRDQAEAEFEESLGFHFFCDLAALNDCLGEESRTVEAFKKAAAENHKAAETIYHVAERRLVAAKCYPSCAPFLEFEERLERARECHAFNKQREESRPENQGRPIPKLARKFFTENVATLIALLVLNDRSDDAKIAYDTALETIDDEDFRSVLDAAMAGQFSF